MRKRLSAFLAVAGPGLVVMLADTDAGSVITAAQSGARWGYKLLALQLLLVPILFVVQELTVRLGLTTGRGHGELIRERFGSFWAWISVSTLMIACVGALVTELSGVAGVGLLFGLPRVLSVGLAVALLIVVVWTGSYRSVERVAILIGLFELVFLGVAWLAHPSLAELTAGISHPPLGDRSYLYLAAANIGAVIMPWMVFYQQSAVVDKGLDVRNLRAARWDTAIGAVITQVIMAAVLIATAATIGRHNPGAPLNTVEQISQALVPFLGEQAGRVLFALGMIGASIVAAIVVSLTAAWGLGEVCSYRRSLQHHPREAPWFYGVFTGAVVGAGALVAGGLNLVDLSVGVEVMNALLLPIVLGFLYLLAIKALPEPYRLRGFYAVVVAVLIVATAGFGVYAAL
ncbi:MAG TPA: divalent metal cation transporter [Candidatus Dormibacteraeota bacterium]|nr:divalent metal cation transporter [Candidatus Dormibacteraeota bacterium]